MDALTIARLIIARFDSDEGDVITNLKLQKILYYAHAWHLVLLEKPLIEEPIQAWDHGPVVPSVYFHYRKYGRNGIIDDVSQDISKADFILLDCIYDVYGEKHAVFLRNLTHKETPWLKNYHQERRNTVIPNNQIRHYFMRHYRQFSIHKAFLSLWQEKNALTLPTPVKDFDETILDDWEITHG